MAGEPSSPPLPAVFCRPHSQAIRTRKRCRPEPGPPLPTTSSDPAWFSSDDDPSIENYVQGRRKKRYVGSWFSHHPPPSESAEPFAPVQPKPGKRTLQRQFDSGIWLESDATTNVRDVSEHVPTPTLPGFSLPTQLSRRMLSQAEHAARTRISECLDAGQENIDLTALGLDTISSDTIAPLSEFSCIPVVQREVAFEQSKPLLKLYLARNNLTTVPGAVFGLDRLNVLSLRGNKLAELPPAMIKLQNLEELNVSQNSLHFLPAEVLSLASPPGKLRKFHIHPNPFFQPMEPELPVPAEDSTGDGDSNHVVKYVRHDDIAAEDFLKERLMSRYNSYDGYTARLVARSPVQYMDVTGTSHSRFQLPGPEFASSRIQTEALDSTPCPPEVRYSRLSLSRRGSRVRSLMELSILAAYKTSQLSVITRYLGDDTPRYIQDAFWRAIKYKEEGGRCCTTCGRMMILARTAWLEWWEIGKVSLDGEAFKLEPLNNKEDEKTVPFLRQGCSWRCIPKPVQKQDWLVGQDCTLDKPKMNKI